MQLKVYPFAGPALRRLNRAGWVTVVVTNQAIIGRGECTPRTMDAIHRKLADTLERDGGRLDAIRICPHAPAKVLKDRGPRPATAASRCRA